MLTHLNGICDKTRITFEEFKLKFKTRKKDVFLVNFYKLSATITNLLSFSSFFIPGIEVNCLLHFFLKSMLSC